MLPRFKYTSIKELKYLAYHDSMTGLLNRNWLYKNLDSLTHDYVYFIDINNLKEVNKEGHTTGDAYIKEIVERIKDLLYSPKDIFIRYAGDEFIVLTNENYTLCLESCKLYAVGFYKNNGNVMEAINVLDAINAADKDMIKEKEKFKTGKRY